MILFLSFGSTNRGHGEGLKKSKASPRKKQETWVWVAVVITTDSFISCFVCNIFTNNIHGPHGFAYEAKSPNTLFVGPPHIR